jgi:hypothetical protein
MTFLSPRRTIRGYFALALLEGLSALTWLLKIPNDPKNARFLGYSTERLFLVIPLLVALLTLLWINGGLWHQTAWADRLEACLVDLANRDIFYLPALLLLAALTISGTYALLIGASLTDLYLRAYYLRAAPFLLWAVLLCLQSLVGLRLLRFGGDLHIFKSQKRAILAGAAVVGVLLLLGTGIAWTKIGLTPDQLGWGDPGVPIMPDQVFLAGVIAAAGGLVVARFRRLRAGIYLDVLICILLWAAAAWIWQAEPQRPSFFAPAPRPPNYAYYPFSDAAGFDTAAHNLLIGEGLGRLATRPLYSFFLALLQAVNGIGYANVIAWQVPLLAFIPPMLYLLGKALHHRLSAVAIAVLAIFHESNAIALLGVINVSNSKLIMSDLPTAAGVILFSGLVVAWLKKSETGDLFSLAAGGVLGLTLLIRLQAAILLPGIVAASWLILRRTPATRLKQLLLMLAGLALVLVPWLWRNWQLTGQFGFSEVSRSSQIGLLGERYSQSIGERERLPGETDDMYAARMMQTAARYLLQHPLDVASFISGQFIHNQIATLLVLPDAFPLVDNLKTFYGRITQGNARPAKVWQDCCGLTAYVKALPYWDNWNGNWVSASFLPLLLNLLLIALGTGVAWERQGLIGLVPWLVNLSYTLGNALIRTSGWRFNLPVDWVGYFYYAIGLAQVCFWVAMFFRNQLVPTLTRQPEPQAKRSSAAARRPWLPVVALGLLFLALASAIPLTERLIPPRYAQDELPVMLSNMVKEGLLVGSGAGGQVSIQDFLKQPGAVALLGRALYPRYYLAGEGEPSSTLLAFASQDYDRLGFILLGIQRLSVILPAATQPAYFPHAADVLVVGCSRPGYVEAGWVVILGPGAQPTVLYGDAPGWTGICPEPGDQ